MRILSDIKHINKYILNPYHDVETGFTTKEKWRITLSALVYDLIVSIAIIAPMMFLIDYYLIALESTDTIIKMTLFKIFFFTVIIAPLFEEIIFRLPLKFNRNPLKVFDNSKSRIENFWKKYFKPTFYILSFAFALIHITNYENRQPLFYILTPIIVLSQGFGGLIIGYIRMHLGFKWAILNHALFNLIVIVVFGLISHQNVVFEKKNNNIDLKINDLSYYEGNYKLNFKLIDTKIVSINMNNETVQVLLDSLYNHRYKTVDNHLAKVKLTTKEPIDKEAFLEILKEEYRIEKKW